MKKATITHTKNQLSQLLEAVPQDETIIIMDSNIPVARLEPVFADSLDDPEGQLARLERKGIIRRAQAAIPTSLSMNARQRQRRGRASCKRRSMNGARGGVTNGCPSRCSGRVSMSLVLSSNKGGENLARSKIAINRRRARGASKMDEVGHLRRLPLGINPRPAARKPASHRPSRHLAYLLHCSAQPPKITAVGKEEARSCS